MHLYRTLSSSAVGSRAQCCSSCHCRISSSNCTTTGEIPLLSEQGHRLNTEPDTETTKHSRQDNHTWLLSSNKLIYTRATLRASSSSRYSCLLRSDSPDRQANEYQNLENVLFTCFYYPRPQLSSSVRQTLLFRQSEAHRQNSTDLSWTVSSMPRRNITGPGSTQFSRKRWAVTGAKSL